MNETRIAAALLLRREATAERHLLVTAGPDAGRRFPVGATQTLGRGRAADLKLSDPAASRLHLRLTLVDGTLHLEDLRSKNGVAVNGKRCGSPRPIDVGDEVAIGGSRLALQRGLLESNPVPPAPAPKGPAERPPAPSRRTLALLAGAGMLAAAAALLLAIP
jgi:pSer/pThr/pTyr-binding forkhead associated (FHA) protein